MVNGLLYTDQQHNQTCRPKKFNCNSSVEKPTQIISATASDDPVNLLRD